jgi:lipoprotein-releasing system permease protein
VAAIGVTFSITMFIALLGFMTGLNKLFDDMILNRTAHIRFYNEIERNPYQPIDHADSYKSFYHFISSVKAANSREEIYNSTAIIHTIRQDKRVKGICSKASYASFF